MGQLEAVAADKTSLGFEFQDLVFIEKLLELKPGESLGLEVFDDIHLETITSKVLLYQVKHSLCGGNVTDRDSDLWKTLANWLKALHELPRHREVGFRLYTNKALNSQKLVSLLKAPGKDIEAIITHIRETHDDIAATDAKKAPDASPNPIASHARTLAQASDIDLRFLFERFEFHADNSGILARIDTLLTYFSVPPSRLPAARHALIGAFKEYKFKTICAKEKVNVSFEDFRNRMGFALILAAARADEANFEEFVDRHYAYLRPQDLSFLNSRFQAQLAELEVTRDEIIDRGIEMKVAEDFIEELRERGLFGQIENLRLENSAHSIWTEIHRDTHHEAHADEAAHRKAAYACYKQTIKEPLTANQNALPIAMSRGKFISLSDQPRIGWVKDWEAKFKP
ncbi:hypothetical protein ACFQ3P_04645 [Paraburkholderia sabiae]|uniref:DUF4297 domain-containing protein n=1 Tax=Paraburkholderia sabiae TaxID=273251 RepID=A0ABU9QMJ0_9BURK|nr:hypothetical protein [Paraburkholderia sabiae]WJZ79152.1 hypothetical protein QEN71_34850 [Paraburkholderia sabiae]